jgi:hypothetical protein
MRLHYQGVRTLNARDPNPVDANPNDPEGADRLRPYRYYDRLAASAVPGSRGIRHTLASAVLYIQSSLCRAKIESRKSVVMSYRTALACTAVTLLVTACSGIPQRTSDEQQLQQYLQYAGAPIDHFTYLSHYDSWRSLSRTQLVVWTTISDAYLLTVREPCINLQFTQRIGLSTTAGTVSNRLDSVLVDRDRCQITEIRPVDYKKMRADLRKSKQ